MGFVDEREIVQLVAIPTEYDDAHAGETHAQNQAHDKAEIPIAPYPDGVPAIMSDRIEPVHRMHGNADQFGKRRNRLIDAIGQEYETTSGHRQVFLHEPVEAAAAKLAAAQVVFSDVRIEFVRVVRKHDHVCATLECARRITHNATDTLVDERHRQLLRERFRTAISLIVAHVGVADRQIGRPYDHERRIVRHLDLDGFERTRRNQSVYAVQHRYASSKADASLIS